MKTIASLIFLTSLILTYHQLDAQDFTIGVGGGLVIPSFIGGGSDNPVRAGNTLNIGGDFGIYGEYKVDDSKSASYSVGLDYSSQGGLYRLKYLLVPFLVRQTWIMHERSSFYVGAGPFAGVLLDYNQAINPGVIYHPKDFNVGIGAIAGISHKFKFDDRGSIFLEVGSDYGFIRLQRPITQMKGYMFIDFQSFVPMV